MRRLHEYFLSSKYKGSNIIPQDCQFIWEQEEEMLEFRQNWITRSGYGELCLTGGSVLPG